MTEKQARKTLGFGGEPLDRDAVAVAFEAAHRRLAARFQFPKDKAERSTIAKQLSKAGEARDTLLRFAPTNNLATPKTMNSSPKGKKATCKSALTPQRRKSPNFAARPVPAPTVKVYQPQSAAGTVAPARKPRKIVPPSQGQTFPPPQPQGNAWQDFVKRAEDFIRDLWKELAPLRHTLRLRAADWWGKHGDKVMNPFLLVRFEYRGYAAAVIGISTGALIGLWLGGDESTVDAVPEPPAYPVVWTPVEERASSPVKIPDQPREADPLPKTTPFSSGPPRIDEPAFERPATAFVQFHSWPPAEVIQDGKRIASAPSPSWVEIAQGIHWLLFRTNSGMEGTIRLDAIADERYVVKVNLQTGLKEVAVR